ncbi:MAG: 3-deoxy-8-phosphooctulonate synthase [Candidatus Krumholzibacteria bacterium]|nr:3-deoxy-8-phosphooctulonate synthase [Candidatus Krumholzibacteria bacterium]
MEPLKIGGRTLSFSETPLLIAGPCVLEDEGDAVRIARECAEAAAREGFFYIFKSSYLKDNRSSIDSYTGPGLERGLEILRRIRDEIDVPVLTDVHCRDEIPSVAGVCDVIQIPAFLARQTRLVVSAAGTGKVLNLKKAQFLSPEEMGLVVEKARRGGAGGVMVTERGTFFGYRNLVVDFTSFEIMRSFGAPLIFDATHSLQFPGGLGNRSGGRPEYSAVLARAAVAAGCDGLFIETHLEPLSCRCDAEVMLPLERLPELLGEAAELYRLVRSFASSPALRGAEQASVKASRDESG